MNDTITIPRATVQQALDALETGLAFSTHSPVLGNLRTALEQQAEPAYDEGYKAGWSDAQPRQQAEPVQETEAFGFVTVRRLSQRFENHHDQYQFYPAGQIPYLDNVDECHTVYTAPPQRKPLPKGEWPKHKSPYVKDEYIGYAKSDLDDYAMQVLAAHGIKEGT